jgi:hypothetical protein
LPASDFAMTVAGPEEPNVWFVHVPLQVPERVRGVKRADAFAAATSMAATEMTSAIRNGLNVAGSPASAKTRATLPAVILFPIALIWLVVVLVWIIRNSTNEPDQPEHAETWRRFAPRVPRRPWGTGAGARGGRKASTRR